MLRIVIKEIKVVAIRQYKKKSLKIEIKEYKILK